MNKKDQLKIGVVVDQLLPGGVQLAAIEEVREFNRLGHQAQLLIVMRKKYSFQFQDLIKNIPHRYLSDSFPWPFRSTFKFPIFSFFSTLHLLSYFFVKKIVRKKDFDLLIAHSTAVSFATLALPIRYLAIIHDPLAFILKKVYSKTWLKYFFPLLIPLAFSLEKRFVSRALQTIIDSPVHQKFIIQKYQITPQIIPHGSEILSVLPKKRGSSILAFSRWQKEKNVNFLLQLIKVLPKTKLIIAGVWTRQKDLIEFKQKIKRWKLSNRVLLIPQFTDSELTSLCSQARLWLHPHFEAFGLAGLQAAAHGLPLVMPAKSGVTSLFTPCEAGFFPEKLTLKDFLIPIKKLLNNERLAFKLGQNAWLKVKNNYSWSARAQKIIALSQQALTENKLPHLTVLEISHAGSTGLSGGDKLLEEMAKRFTTPVRLHVITSTFGSLHWKKSQLKLQLTRLKTNPFETGSDPVNVFLSYLWRITQVSGYLLKHGNKIKFLYSSTNILPDVLPAFLFKLFNPQTIWLGRVHHLVPPPFKREGLLAVNFVSWSMQKISLLCFKTKANLTFCLNRQLFTTLKDYGFSLKRLAVLGAGIDFTWISHYQPQNNPGFEAVYLGRLHTVKGIFDCLSIWKKVTTIIPRAKLAIIGAGPTFIIHELVVKIKKFKLTKNIKILGYLPENKIYDYLKTAKVFLFTDHEAGWGMAIAEAMAAGLPVVGYDIGILGSVYHQGFILVPLKNTTYFSTKVVELLQNNKLRKKIALEAYGEARKFDWKNTNQKFIKYLNSLTAKFA